jgi:hypothetical protein
MLLGSEKQSELVHNALKIRLKKAIIHVLH